MEAPPQPDVSIIYINRGMGRLLRRSLDSLREGGIGQRSAEVLVVHCPNPAEEGLRAELEAAYPGLRWLEEPRFGVALLRNAGIRAARGRHVCMLDADTLATPGAFDALVDFMDAHPRVGGCGPRTIRPSGELEMSCKRFYTLGALLFRRTPLLGRLFPNNAPERHHLMADADHSRRLDIDWMAGACYMMRREAIEQIGVFDEGFYFGFEDVDWCYRAKLAGWTIAYVPEAEIVHDAQRLSARGVNRMAWEHLKSGVRFWLKHRRRPKPAPAKAERVD
jgi:GT2 family glycosyltransferase